MKILINNRGNSEEFEFDPEEELKNKRAQNLNASRTERAKSASQIDPLAGLMIIVNGKEVNTIIPTRTELEGLLERRSVTNLIQCHGESRKLQPAGGPLDRGSGFIHTLLERC